MKVLNATLIKGAEDISEVNGYIKQIGWTTGVGSSNIFTINPDATPIDNNPTMADYKVTMTFSFATFNAFLNLLNDRTSQFDMTLSVYAIGDLTDNVRYVYVTKARLSETSFGNSVGDPDAKGSVMFVATNVKFISADQYTKAIGG